MPPQKITPTVKSISIVGLLILAGGHNLNMYLHHDIWFIMDGVNLIFHEAGHMFMMFFGQFLHIFGGTLFELGIPIIVTQHFYRRRDWLGAAFGTWWLSTAFVDVSIYASDAQARVLPLLGGNAVGHDWYNLLSLLGILDHDQFVGDIFLTLSLLSSILFLYCSWQSLQKKNLPHFNA